MSQTDWEHGLDEWTDGYIDGFEEAVCCLAKAGCLDFEHSPAETFFELAGLSTAAKKSIQKILKVEMSK